jgi:hypothetical protein
MKTFVLKTKLGESIHNITAQDKDSATDILNKKQISSVVLLEIYDVCEVIKENQKILNMCSFLD